MKYELKKNYNHLLDFLLFGSIIQNMLGTDFFLFTVFILLPVAVCARNVRTPPSPIPPNSHATVNSTKSLVTFLFSVSGFYYVTSKSFIL